MTKHQTQRPLTLALACLALAGIGVASMTGCRGDRSNKPPRQFFPDLDHQEKYDPQEESHFFKDYVDPETGKAYGRTQRLPVAGTVPFGRKPYVTQVMGIDMSHRAEFLRDDDAWAEGRTFRMLASGAPMMKDDGTPVFDWVETIPFTVDQGLIDIGHKQFDIYCLPCHGGLGDGQGLVGQRWSYAIPSFHDAVYQPGDAKGQDGYIFHVIRNGVVNVGGPYPLKMPSYARKLTIDETWAVVAYLRVLQETRKGSIDELPESQRIELMRSRTGTAGTANQETNQ